MSEEQLRAKLVGDPKLVVEVFSPSTRREDERVKLPEYQSLTGVEVILLVDPEAERVRLVARTGPDDWLDRLLHRAMMCRSMRSGSSSRPMRSLPRLGHRWPLCGSRLDRRHVLLLCRRATGGGHSGQSQRASHLLEALGRDVIGARPEDFYYLARATFVKDESLLDRFDQVFGKVFKGLETSTGPRRPRSRRVLRKVAELYLTPSRWPKSKRSAPGTRSWRR
jgi:hypothetical protein